MSVGVVVIGRNEGLRLKRCIESLEMHIPRVVYVDSGSTDDSVEMVRSMGVRVVDLDMQIPFTAARARNTGFECLLSANPQLKYVQFVDGDCEISTRWIESALVFLEVSSDIVVVAGRLRERFPDASVYNMLCDIEWSAPLGEAKACGGIAMMRVDAFTRVGGFNIALICGEEPELCSRLRDAGGRIWRLDNDMGWHDANITQFSQWWIRSVRAGYSFAQAVYMTSSLNEHRGVEESLRIWIWGAIIPVGVFALSIYSIYASLVFLTIYPLQIVRLALKGRWRERVNWIRSYYLMLGKFPELQGQLKFIYQLISGKQSKIIEHK